MVYTGSARTRSQATRGRSPAPPTGPLRDCIRQPPENYVGAGQHRLCGSLAGRTNRPQQRGWAIQIGAQLSAKVTQGAGGGPAKVLVYADSVDRHKVEGLHDQLQAIKWSQHVDCAHTCAAQDCTHHVLCRAERPHSDQQNDIQTGRD